MASFGMSEAHKKALRSNRLALVQRLIVDEEFMAVFIQNNMLTEIQKENFDVHKTKNKRAGWVIDFLPKKGPKAMEVFIEALMITKQGELADLVAKDLADKWRQEHPDEAESDSDDPDDPPVPMDTSITRTGTMETEAGADGTTGYVYSHPDGRVEIINPENQLIPIVVPSATTSFVKSIEDNKTEKYGIKRKGLTVIVNVENFHGETTKGVKLSKRFGTDVDVVNIENLFKNIGYSVQSWKDYDLQKLKVHLKLCATSDIHQNGDSFVMVILSHGFLGGFYTADSQEMNLKELVAHFSSANCSFLADKPKMFFIQACQGVEKTPGVVVPKETTDVDVPSVDELSEQVEMLGLSQDEITNENTLHDIVSDERNVFMAFSTVPKYVSIRHEKNGTWFIRDLVTVFSEKAFNTSLQDMMTEVIRKVSERRSSRIEPQMNPTTGKRENVPCKYIQIAFTLNTLPKNVYFLPGIKG